MDKVRFREGEREIENEMKEREIEREGNALNS